MESLKEWLATKNVTVEQFMGLAETSEDFLDRKDHAYSPKLAATIAAWRYVKKNHVSGASIKQQLMDWLRENSARYWPDDMGEKVTDTFIKEAARLANWDAEGGRPSLNDDKNSAKANPKNGDFQLKDSRDFNHDFSTDFDDEIPF